MWETEFVDLAEEVGALSVVQQRVIEHDVLASCELAPDVCQEFGQ
jgi:hypothetical protein